MSCLRSSVLGSAHDGVERAVHHQARAEPLGFLNFLGGVFGWQRGAFSPRSRKRLALPWEEC
jgi:hypothetical protein